MSWQRWDDFMFADLIEWFALFQGTPRFSEEIPRTPEGAGKDGRRRAQQRPAGVSHTRTHTHMEFWIYWNQIRQKRAADFWHVPRPSLWSFPFTFSEWRVSHPPAETALWPQMTSCLGCILSAATGCCLCGLGLTCCKSWRATSGCVTVMSGSCCASGLRRSWRTERWVRWPGASAGGNSHSECEVLEEQLSSQTLIGERDPGFVSSLKP